MENAEISFRQVADLSKWLKNREIASWSVCSDSSICLLLVKPGDVEKAHPSGSKRESYDAWFMRCEPNRVIDEVGLGSMEIRFPKVASFSDGFILVVSSRGANENAFLYEQNGGLRRKFSVGDAVEDVQVTPGSRIWVSYFDEAALPGIACFDRRGNKQWTYPPDDSDECVDDCYSMNVIGETVWTCYYSEFPVVKIAENREITVWRNRYAAQAVAVLGDSVALHHPKNICIIQKCGNTGSMERAVEYKLEAPGPPPVNGYWPVKARNEMFHALTDSHWFQLDLSALV